MEKVRVRLPGYLHFPYNAVFSLHKPPAAFYLSRMKFILARKVSMTQIFTDEGRMRAGTILKTGPIEITQVKSSEKDGYTAVQVGFDTQKPQRLSKPVLGHLKGKAFKVLKEFRLGLDDTSAYSIGDEITADIFSVGDKVRVAGTSKGKGFAGVVKRYGFHGGPRTHGQKHSEREPGSIGGSGGRAGGRVAKGIRMGGRMGSDRITTDGLTVLAVDSKLGEIIVSGAVPGSRDSLVEIVSL
ncbi:MAG TPA: 50S ribosomal protein L3 [Candidatus Kaiserbacteria bacterium]|nr:50S ribosomal protein L3 [Candidatus Kaiserbacteria bacterium]